MKKLLSKVLQWEIINFDFRIPPTTILLVLHVIWGKEGSKIEYFAFFSKNNPFFQKIISEQNYST